MNVKLQKNGLVSIKAFVGGCEICAEAVENMSKRDFSNGDMVTLKPDVNSFGVVVKWHIFVQKSR